MESDDSCSFKIILVGSAKTGKTSLIHRYCHDIFNSETRPTLGSDYLEKNITRKDMKINLRLWDTAGQDQFRSLSRLYYKEAHGIVLVYDITNEKSFKDLKLWIGDIKQYGNGLEEKILVGNKSDLYSDQEVSLMDGKKFSAEIESPWCQCSAKTGDGVNLVFNNIIDNIIERYKTDIEFKNIGRSNTVIYNSLNFEDDTKNQSIKKLNAENTKVKMGFCCK